MLRDGKKAFEEPFCHVSLVLPPVGRPFAVDCFDADHEETDGILIDSYVVHDADAVPFLVELAQLKLINGNLAACPNSEERCSPILEMVPLKVFRNIFICDVLGQNALGLFLSFSSGLLGFKQLSGWPGRHGRSTDVRAAFIVPEKVVRQ